MGVIEKQSIQDIANAIRNRNGLTTLYKPREMDEAILNLYSTTKVNSMLDYILPCHEEEATDFTIKYADSDRPCSISELEGNTTQNGTPTPTSPVEIKTVSGDNNIVVSNEQHVTGNSYRVDLGGKNLWTPPETTEIDGITYTKNANGTFNLSGTATAKATIYLFKTLAESGIVNGQSYAFSTNTTLTSGIEVKIEGYSDSAWVRHIVNVLNSSNSTRTATANLTNVTRIRYAITVSSGTTVNLNNIGIQLELGSVATRYSPYVSNPIELCKIGNYKDTLFHAVTGNPKYDSLDNTTKESLTYGNWYVEKNIGKRVFTGDTNTETWAYATSGGYPRVTTNSITDGYRYNDANRHIGKFLSSHFTPNTTDNTGHCYQYQASYLFNPTSDITSVATWRTWLGSNPMTLYYQLANPTYEVITNTNLIEQLNNLQDITLIENLCYVDWVGIEKPKMKLFCYLDKDKIIEEITG